MLQKKYAIEKNEWLHNSNFQEEKNMREAKNEPKLIQYKNLLLVFLFAHPVHICAIFLEDFMQILF